MGGRCTGQWHEISGQMRQTKPDSQCFTSSAGSSGATRPDPARHTCRTSVQEALAFTADRRPARCARAILSRLASADDSLRGDSGANCGELDCRLWPPVPGVDLVPLAPVGP